MIEITNIDDNYNQQFQYVVEGYDTAYFNIYFKPRQLSWFMDLTFGNVEIFGERIAVSPNLLRQFKNRLPFGIAIYGPDLVDPFAVDAFLKGWKFYILSKTEINEIEDDFYGR